MVKRILYAVLKLIAVIIGILFITIASISAFFIARIVKDGKENTYTLHINREDRLVKGMYIPSRHRAFTNRISLTLNGETFQECQLVLITSARNSKGPEVYSTSRRKLLLP